MLEDEVKDLKKKERAGELQSLANLREIEIALQGAKQILEDVGKPEKRFILAVENGPPSKEECTSSNRLGQGGLPRLRAEFVSAPPSFLLSWNPKLLPLPLLALQNYMVIAKCFVVLLWSVGLLGSKSHLLIGFANALRTNAHRKTFANAARGSVCERFANALRSQKFQRFLGLGFGGFF